MKCFFVGCGLETLTFVGDMAKLDHSSVSPDGAVKLLKTEELLQLSPWLVDAVRNHTRHMSRASFREGRRAERDVAVFKLRQFWRLRRLILRYVFPELLEDSRAEE